MPQTHLTELRQLADTARDYVDDELVVFLEQMHTRKLDVKISNKKVSKALEPVEAFELEVKHKLSNAAHELIQATMRIKDSQTQNSELDVTDYLRYAKTNLEEAAKDMEAASINWNALNKYADRIDIHNVQLAAFVKDIVEKLAEHLLKTKDIHNKMYEFVLMAINEEAIG